MAIRADNACGQHCRCSVTLAVDVSFINGPCLYIHWTGAHCDKVWEILDSFPVRRMFLELWGPWPSGLDAYDARLLL